MLVRTCLFIGVLIGMLALAPPASSSAAQRLTPTPGPTTIRLRALARPRATPTATPTPANAAIQANIARSAAGKRVYLDHYCGSCHTLAAAGTAGIFGPSHDHIGTVAAQRIANPRYRGEAKTAAEYIRESILTPAAFLAPTAGFAHQQMPPFTDLAPEELDALVYFLLQQE